LFIFAFLTTLLISQKHNSRTERTNQNNTERSEMNDSSSG
jgi:hypothetical protein